MYVVCYDITDTKRRNKIFKTLKNYGQHKQYSVFECRIGKQKMLELYAKLICLMQDEEEGSIRIYRICTNCEEQIHTIGTEPGNLAKEDLFVI